MFFVRSLIVSKLGIKLLAKTIGLSRLHIPLCGQRCYLFGFADYNLVTLREYFFLFVELLIQVIYKLRLVLLIGLAFIAKHKAH